MRKTAVSIGLFSQPSSQPHPLGKVSQASTEFSWEGRVIRAAVLPNLGRAWHRLTCTNALDGSQQLGQAVLGLCILYFPVQLMLIAMWKK